MSEEIYLLNRRAKMEAVGKSKVYRNDFRRQALAAELQSRRRESGTGRSHATMAGRVMLRVMGKASFVTCTRQRRFSVI